jgi:hypothetical protein
MRQAFARWSLVIPLAFIAVGSSSCATPRDRAAAIVSAATAGHLRPVVACWEKEYESSGFEGEYIAIVDFEIGGDEHFRNAQVKSLENKDQSSPTRDLTAFRECIEKALNEVELPTKTDADGPGYSAIIGVAVHNYRIAFLGDQEGRRQEAGGRQANILIGPRADRCQGMYSYNPPRDSSTLFTEISLVQAKPAPAQDKDAQAREFQKIYDLQLELAARLEADLANGSLPAANRKRLVEALEKARGEITATGERIGCGATRSAK